jgi:hypothetical protein
MDPSTRFSAAVVRVLRIIIASYDDTISAVYNITVSSIANKLSSNEFKLNERAMVEFISSCISFYDLESCPGELLFCSASQVATNHLDRQNIHISVAFRCTVDK